MEKTALAKLLAQAEQKFAGHALFGRSQSGRVPLLPIHVVDGNESGLATHRQADVTRGKLLVNALSQLVKPLPLFLRIGLGDAGGLQDAP